MAQTCALDTVHWLRNRGFLITWSSPVSHPELTLAECIFGNPGGDCEVDGKQRREEKRRRRGRGLGERGGKKKNRRTALFLPSPSPPPSLSPPPPPTLPSPSAVVYPPAPASPSSRDQSLGLHGCPVCCSCLYQLHLSSPQATVPGGSSNRSLSKTKSPATFTGLLFIKPTAVLITAASFQSPIDSA